MELQDSIRQNLQAVRARIETAARAAGRSPSHIRLVAVSKTFGEEHVRAAAASGQQEFGENRVQEALQKIAATSELQIGWHLIGHLQSNKARKAATAFSWIQSVDSLELLKRLDEAASAQGARPGVLVQVDLAGEATKFGAPPAAAREIVREGARCAALRLRGLMLLPPWFDEPGEARPYFARLRELRDELVAAGEADAASLHELSMGMSHDFEAAILEGSTMVRIGTAIFGKRSAHV
jgi:hypothetical protein